MNEFIDFEQYEQRFIDFLRKKGLKYTPERRLVLRTVHSASDHLEAEDILLITRQHGERVSKATIYRTLTLMEESGLIQTMNFGNRHAHFEPVLAGHQHAHIVCVNCERVIEFSDEELERLWNEICARHGVTPLSHRLVIWGVCDHTQD